MSFLSIRAPQRVTRSTTRHTLTLTFCLLMTSASLLAGAAPWKGENATSADQRLESWVTRAEVERPETYENLALYPIEWEPGHLPPVQTLDQALQHGGLKVSEVNESGSVNTLLVENLGKQPVFIMAGEILSGAKQDRILQHDLWLSPHSGKVDIQAYCVEHGRWEPTSGSYSFKSKATVSNLAVRDVARASKSQASVWRSVDETNLAAGVAAAPTHALNSVYEDRRVRSNVDDITNHFLEMVRNHPRMGGVVVQIGDTILAADCFADRRTLVELWPKLLKSYALEAFTRSKGSPGVRAESARKFLIQAAAAEDTREATPGQGTLLELSSASVSGEALVMAEGVAHLELFPRVGRSSYPSHPIEPIRRHYPGEGVTPQGRD